MSDSLPDKPSSLIHFAIGDLRTVLDTPGYRVRMNDWHKPSSDGVFGGCYVCLAGAVMAVSLHADPYRVQLPLFYPEDTRRKLKALDCFRRGHISYGLYVLGLEQIPSEMIEKAPQVPAFNEAMPYLFCDAMLELAQFLADFGL